MQGSEKHKPSADDGKVIDLGRKCCAEVKPKGLPEKSYPSMYLDHVSASSPLGKKEVGSTFEAVVSFKVKRLSTSDDGFSIDLEARSLKL